VGRALRRPIDTPDSDGKDLRILGDPSGLPTLCAEPREMRTQPLQVQWQNDTGQLAMRLVVAMGFSKWQ
jgi:hypothetical protein